MPIRLTGMASGLDTDTLVKQLMQAKRVPVDRMVQKQVQLTWKRDQYRETNTMLSQLRDMSVSMKLQSTMGAKKVTSSADTIATATATATAMNGNHTIKITQLAKTASVTSDALGLQNNRTQPLTSTELQLTVAGERGSKLVKIEANSTIDSVIEAINSQTSATGVSAQYDRASDRLYLNSSSTGAQAFMSIGGNDAASENFLRNTLKLNANISTTNQTASGDKVLKSTSTVINTAVNPADPATFTITQGSTTATMTITNTTTLIDLQDQIAKAGLDMTVTLNAEGKVKFEGATAFTLAEGANNGLSKLLFTSGPVNSAAATSVFTRGTDAMADYGTTTGIRFHSNDFIVNNINVSAKQLGTVTFTVNTDSDALVKTVKDFVTKYNEIIEKLNTKITEKTYRDFLPLTDEQKKDMKEDDIKRWEEKAKSGMLRSDTTLSSLLSNMRLDLSNQVSGVNIKFNSLAAIGITSGGWTENGKLTLNETKLRDVLTTNPTEVMNLFTTQGDGSAKGLASRLYDSVTKTMKDITDKAGSTADLKDKSVIGEEINDYATRIDQMTRRLSAYEDAYYIKFSKLEAAMSKANSQSQWLSSQLGGMSQ